MENLTLKVEGSTGEIIIREGEAPKVVYPQSVSVDGDIRTVRVFIGGRKALANLQGVNAETALVTVNKEKGTILLQTDPNSVYSSTVRGTLLTSDELALFNINGSTTFTQKDLIKVLKFNRIHFADPQQQQDLLQKYMAFTFSTSTEGHAKGDDRGNKSAAVTKAVTTNLPTNFTLKIPIYKGERSLTFQVEICLDVTDAGARFWFESVELHELQQTEKEIIFERELKAAEGLVVIYK